MQTRIVCCVNSVSGTGELYAGLFTLSEEELPGRLAQLRRRVHSCPRQRLDQALLCKLSVTAR